MKCQILFPGKNKKNIINLSSAENAQRVVKVKEIGDETSVIDITGIKVFGYQDNIKFNNYKKNKKNTKTISKGTRIMQMVDFPPFVYKGYNFCDFMFAYLYTFPFWKGVYSKRKGFAPNFQKGDKIF